MRFQVDPSMRMRKKHLSYFMTSMVSSLVGIGLLFIGLANAVEANETRCFTDKSVYMQGDNVTITIANNTSNEILVAQRKHIDGGFATVEIKRNDGTWAAIELYAAANIIVYKTLKSGDSHTYIWNTVGYNRSDTLAPPGIYRISFKNGLRSNQFEIRTRKPSSRTAPQFRPNEAVGPDPISQELDWRQTSLGHDQGELRRMNVPCEVPPELNAEMLRVLDLRLTYPR